MNNFNFNKVVFKPVGDGSSAILETAQEQPVQEPDDKPQKVSFYLETELHLDKLDDLVRLYRKKTGRRINRQDVVRKLIENSSIESLLG